jgi:RNA polymerase sigma-70 factor (ECF subfamily)
VTSPDDRLRLARQGDLDAFNELVLEHQALVYNLCYSMLGHRQAAEDASQEAFISAYRNLSGLRGGAFRPWLLRIAANACHDELRRRARRRSSSLDVALEEGVPEPPDPDPSPEASALTAELQREIHSALQTLPEEQRLALVLCDLEGLDYAEIAQTMRCSLGTVKSRIARGRARLRVLLSAFRELPRSLARPE